MIVQEGLRTRLRRSNRRWMVRRAWEGDRTVEMSSPETRSRSEREWWEGEGIGGGDRRDGGLRFRHRRRLRFRRSLRSGRGMRQRKERGGGGGERGGK